MSEYLEVAHELHSSGLSFVTVTMITTRGHAPQDEGAKIIITDAGYHWGTIGGGKIEAKTILHAQELLKKTTTLGSEFVTWNLQKDVGMTCGGEVSLFFEVSGKSKWNVAVLGAGHVAQAVVRALLPLQCQVRCLDPREEWIAKLPKSPKLKAEVALNLSESVKGLSPDTFFVVMTQGHTTDVPVLYEIFKTFPDTPYIGCMGSDIKAKKMKKELLEKGIEASQIERFKSPIGFAIGQNDPAEIAVSVVAQLLEVRDRFKASLKA